MVLQVRRRIGVGDSRLETKSYLVRERYSEGGRSTLLYATEKAEFPNMTKHMEGGGSYEHEEA